ncbi:MAG: D-glycero-beta-D-manno-heptose-7-phosphate kinase [Rhodospirillales bacterium]|nr:D-glycero-beta-D-manno-heptose-7-phosphate kinase [Alphaproteobacteria bacterium]USO04565.1 MAG: D-glycero-beta-D-manno-heptose-7-phosphate kinase [Rhodospirillales bacterium]
MAGTRVLVIGDIMLDSFVYGEVSRISPESPVPVLSISHDNKMLGGAGNVLSNLSGLGVRSKVISVIGADENGKVLRGIAETLGADASGLIEDDSRPTTLKTRYLSRNHQLLRTDFENTHEVSEEISNRILQEAETAIANGIGAIVLSDYGKGVLTKNIISGIIRRANTKNIPVLVDPKGNDYGCYKDADVVTPNRRELSEATGGMPVKEDSDIVKAAEQLMTRNGIKAVVATRSEDGMSIVRARKEGGFEQPVHLKTESLEVFDVSGAGDTVIATIAAGLATGASLVEAAALANVAGGIVVSKIGTAAIRAAELIKAQNTKEYALQTGPVGDISTIDRARQARVLPLEDAVEQVQKWRARGLRIGFTNGCFDILHAGHVGYLNQARNKCDRLVVGLNHDASIRILKGPDRPVNGQDARASVLGALGSVDMVVFFGAEEKSEDNTPCALVSSLRPDIFFKGGDYEIEDLPEAKIVRSYGGDVRIMTLYEGFSTTSTIEKMTDKKDKVA